MDAAREHLHASAGAAASGLSLSGLLNALGGAAAGGGGGSGDEAADGSGSGATRATGALYRAFLRLGAAAAGPAAPEAPAAPPPPLPPLSDAQRSTAAELAALLDLRLRGIERARRLAAGAPPGLLDRPAAGVAATLLALKLALPEANSLRWWRRGLPRSCAPTLARRCSACGRRRRRCAARCPA